MRTIARLNWPMFAAAGLAALVCAGGVMKVGRAGRWLSASGLAGALYFLIGSLGVSHWIYDRSDLYRWKWLRRALSGIVLRRAIVCHCGFDEVSRALRSELPEAELIVIDHFDEVKMTEPSIHRARRLFPPEPGTLAAPHDRWPATTGSADVVFALLAIHELRSQDDRCAWFAEAHRCVTAVGRVVLLEHTRDVANFVAYGPGYLHFHSPSTWCASWEAAGWQCADEFNVTPWVQVFVLRKT